MPQTLYNYIALLIADKTVGVDSTADYYINNPDDSIYLACIKIHKDDLRRCYIEAGLLASSNTDEVALILDMDPEVIGTYSKIYYDVSEFDRIDKMSMIELSDNEDEKSLKLWAVSQGIDFLAWRLGKNTNISAVEGLSELFSDCIFKSKEALFNENASIASRESTKWVKLSIDIARLLKIWITDNKAASKDIKMALKRVVPDFMAISDLDSPPTKKAKPTTKETKK